MKENTTSFQVLFQILFVFVISISVSSQSISKPTFLFTNACASATFSSYPVNFNFAPVASFASGNVFYLQLSDASGNFTTVTEVANSNTITTSPGQLVFLVSSSFVGGEGFKFRIRSTNPALLSPESNVVPIHYKSFTNNFYINNRLPTAKFCTGSKITLAIDDPTAAPSSLTNLTYKWYKNNVVINGAITTFYDVNSAGTYYCEINYGSCSNFGDITRSQDVVVTSTPGLQPIVIVSSSGVKVAIGSPTTLTTVQNSTYSYQWFKDGILIIGATNFNHVTDQAGEYYVVVKNTDCSVESNKISLILSTISNATVIPNMVTPNNDSINDTWAIPADYISGTGTEILITDAVGKEVLKTKNYTNDWPTATIEYQSANPVYYYIITSTSGETKKGTITIIK